MRYQSDEETRDRSAAVLAVAMSILSFIAGLIAGGVIHP